MGNTYPNPFQQGEGASIEVQVKEGDRGVLSIYNLSGQKIVSYPVNPGTQTITRNALDNSGSPCAQECVSIT